MIYAICINAKPATLKKLYENEQTKLRDATQEELYLCAPTRQKAIDLYLHYFGFTWPERPKNISCEALFTK